MSEIKFKQIAVTEEDKEIFGLAEDGSIWVGKAKINRDVRLHGVCRYRWEKVELPEEEKQEINYKELNEEIAQSAKDRGLE